MLILSKKCYNIPTNMKKILLLGVTFILLLTGFLVIYLKFYGTDLVNLTRKKPTAADTNINQSDSVNTKPVEGIISQDQFVKSNLKYNSSFIGFSVPVSVENAPSKVVVDSISYSNKTLKVILQQEQLCTEDRDLPSQGGFYFSEDNIVTLYNIVNNSAVKDGKKCVARIQYDIDNVVVDASKNLSIKWQTESGAQTTLPICFYNGQPYNDDDVFASTAKCNTCTCSNGVIKCEVNNKCVENEKKATEAANEQAESKAKAEAKQSTPENVSDTEIKADSVIK
jgi:hypothetical protein